MGLVWGKGMKVGGLLKVHGIGGMEIGFVFIKVVRNLTFAEYYKRPDRGGGGGGLGRFLAVFRGGDA